MNQSGPQHADEYEPSEDELKAHYEAMEQAILDDHGVESLDDL